MSRNKIFAAVALIVGLLVVVVVLTDFPPGDSSVAGTMADPDQKIAGAEKADRTRIAQMDADDVEIDDATFQTLMQNEDFVAVVSDGNFALAEALDRALDRVDVNRSEVYARLAGDRSLSRAAAEFEKADSEESFARAEDFLKAELEKALGKAFERGAFDRGDYAKEAMERGDLDRDAMEKADMDRGDMERALERGDMEKAAEGLDRADLEKAAEGLDRADLDRGDMERALERGDMEKAAEGLDRADLEKAAEGFDRELARILSREDLDRAFERGLSREMARDLSRGLEKADWARAADMEKVFERADGDWARVFDRSDLARVFERGYNRADAERSAGARAEQ